MPTPSLPGLLPCLRMELKGSLNGLPACPMTTATGMRASQMTVSTQTQKRRTVCRYGTNPLAVRVPETRAPARVLGRCQASPETGELGHCRHKGLSHYP